MASDEAAAEAEVRVSVHVGDVNVAAVEVVGVVLVTRDDEAVVIRLEPSPKG
jgi:hypothetical protein